MDDTCRLRRYARVVTTRRERDAQGSQDSQAAGEPDRAAEDWQARLGQAMEARALSGGELARRAGFTSQYVNSLRSGDRGARLPLDTARKLAHALGVSVDWLTKGEGPRERLSDVYVVGGDGTARTATPYRPPAPSDLYPSRGEAIALLAKVVEPEVIEALRAVVPETDGDPGREFWIAYAKDLARDLRRITNDPDLNARRERDAPPKSAYMPAAKKKS
jgi:transcriptional regulator with XRE-family HTH domain